VPISAARNEVVPISAAELDFLDESTAGVPERLAREALAHGLDLEALEGALLAAALEETRGNVAAAARIVGLTRRAFELRHERHARGTADVAGDADDADADADEDSDDEDSDDEGSEDLENGSDTDAEARS
jgi:hypothetical protein